MPSISPCLWFNNQAEEAVVFYSAIFKDSRVLAITRYGKGAPMPEGSVMTIKFLLDGREFFAFNGGPAFPFTPAVSFVVYCKTQEELDEKWERLSDGGEQGQCGWLKDRYGVSWQVVPAALEKMMKGEDRERSQRVVDALLKMKKLDIEVLEGVYRS